MKSVNNYLARVIVSLLESKKIKYLAVGGTAFLIEYICFAVLNYATNWLVLANILSFTVGLATSFLLHRIWTFSSSGYNHSGRHQFTAYFILAVINLLLTSILISVLVNVLSINPLIAKLVCMALIVVWNYVLLSKVIFK